MMNLTGYFYYKNFTRIIRSNNKAENYSTGDFFDNALKDNKKHIIKRDYLMAMQPKIALKNLIVYILK
jgi:hypothetical protein